MTAQGLTVDNRPAKIARWLANPCQFQSSSWLTRDRSIVAQPIIMPQRLYDAADRGDAAAVAEFLREGDDANEAANDWAPLHVACFKGHFDAVKALLEGGADVKATVRDEHDEARHRGATPLHMAARHGSVVVVNLLLERGADVDQATQSVLWKISQDDHVEVAELLRDAKKRSSACNVS